MTPLRDAYQSFKLKIILGEGTELQMSWSNLKNDGVLTKKAGCLLAKFDYAEHHELNRSSSKRNA